MTNLVEHLKEAENAGKTGFSKGGWKPHKSHEKGTDTLAYGHKLSKEEHDGGYVILPDGSIHSFEDGGITEEQAFDLLISDIKKRKGVAKIQWNKANKDHPFDSLEPMHQDLLAEIAFNVRGGLNNRAGNFGWKKLAKAIKAGDVEGIKKESTRTSGGKSLKLRNEQVANFIDNWQPSSVQATEGNVEQEVIAGIQSQLGQENVAQAAPESVSEPVNELSEDDERIVQMMMSELQGLPTEVEEDTIDGQPLSAEDEEIIAQMMLGIEHKGLAFEEAEEAPDEFDFINRIYG